LTVPVAAKAKSLHPAREAHRALFSGSPGPNWAPRSGQAARLVDLDRVRQGLCLSDVFWIGWVDEGARGSEEIACADLLSRAGVILRRVDGFERVTVLVGQ
jgi:hypothetical protein